MFTQGEVVRLMPTTKRHKQVVHEHGRRWRVLSEPHAMACFDGEEGVRIGCTHTGCVHRHVRNVRLHDVAKLGGI